LAAIQEGCADTTCVVVTILEFIPPPVVQAPNVFSPNGDDANDVWKFILLEFIDDIELVILNRWGNVVNEQTSATPTWDGKLQDGSDANDGVYFYKYKALGLDGSTIEGHGQITLFRD
jgi:gliding motility-associated-like protein